MSKKFKCSNCEHKWNPREKNSEEIPIECPSCKRYNVVELNKENSESNNQNE